MPHLFDTARAAEGYAKARPPLHARIVERITTRAATALDVGCGAGLSTAPLLRIAGSVMGIDPFPEMVKWGHRVAPGARFAAGRAEALPFRSGAFELITAAGSLNYAEPAAAFRELRRVIADGGALCVYDFNQADFPYERPPDGSIPLGPEILAEMENGFRVSRSERFEIPLSMTHEQYLAYLQTEVDVPPPEFRPSWALRFRGYIAWLTPASL